MKTLISAIACLVLVAVLTTAQSVNVVNGNNPLRVPSLNVGSGTYDGVYPATIREFDNSDFAGIKVMSLNEGAFIAIGRSGISTSNAFLLNTPYFILGGHQYNSTTVTPAPTVAGTTTNSCGTTAPVIVGADMAGKVTVGTVAGTSCTITFGANWLNAPACMVTNETTANLVRATSTISTVVLAGTMVAGDKLAYQCQGYYP